MCVSCDKHFVSPFQSPLKHLSDISGAVPVDQRSPTTGLWVSAGPLVICYMTKLFLFKPLTNFPLNSRPRSKSNSFCVICAVQYYVGFYL